MIASSRRLLLLSSPSLSHTHSHTHTLSLPLALQTAKKSDAGATADPGEAAVAAKKKKQQQPAAVKKKKKADGDGAASPVKRKEAHKTEVDEIREECGEKTAALQTNMKEVKAELAAGISEKVDANGKVRPGACCCCCCCAALAICYSLLSDTRTHRRIHTHSLARARAHTPHLQGYPDKHKADHTRFGCKH